jgi:hypothetical protein
MSIARVGLEAAIRDADDFAEVIEASPSPRKKAATIELAAQVV